MTFMVWQTDHITEDVVNSTSQLFAHAWDHMPELKRLISFHKWVQEGMDEALRNATGFIGGYYGWNIRPVMGTFYVATDNLTYGPTWMLMHLYCRREFRKDFMPKFWREINDRARLKNQRHIMTTRIEGVGKYTVNFRKVR